MANTLITPSVIASTALATLYNTIVLAGLVSRDFDRDFTGRQGDTITVRKPAVFTMRKFDRRVGIELQDATEDSVRITVDQLGDVSFPVTSEDMALRVQDFRAQFLTPALEAIAQGVDGDLAEGMVDAALGGGGGGTVRMTSVASDLFTGEDGLVAKMGRAKMPDAGRAVVFSPEGQGVALEDRLFVEANTSGSTDALRRASIGTVFGFETYGSQTFGYGSGDKGRADGVAFHRATYVLATAALPVPDGVAPNQAARENWRGLSIRVVKAYDITRKQDVISLDMLYGMRAVRPEGIFVTSMSIGS